MTEMQVSGGPASRVLGWLRTPAELAILGALWVMASLPVVTVVFATSALFASLRARDADDAERLSRTFAGALRTTFPHAARLSVIVIPVLLAQISITTWLVLSRVPVAFVALGVLGVLSAVWIAFLLTLHTQMCLYPSRAIREQARAALGHLCLRPGTPLLAVLVGATIVAAAAQSLWVAGIFTASLPAWIVYHRHPSRIIELEDEAHDYH